MSQDGKRRVNAETVSRGLRQGADLLERDDVRRGIDTVEELIHGHDHVPVAVPHEDREPEAPRRPAAMMPPAPPPATPAPTPVTTTDSATIARDGYTCLTPFSPVPADVVVVCCSSEKFELQHQEFIKALGYTMPHFIQVPGGPASLYSLAVVSGFMSKALGTFVDKAVELVGVDQVILIAHEECGAYKQSGRVSVLGQLTRRLTGKTMKEAQVEHLQKAAREVQARLGHDVQVRSYYANLVESGGVRKIRFEPTS